MILSSANNPGEDSGRHAPDIGALKKLSSGEKLVGELINTGESQIAHEFLSGSLGVRGLIIGLESMLPTDQREHLERSLRRLEALEVRRVHLILPSLSRVGSIAEEIGFYVPEGESLFIRSAAQRPANVSDLPKGCRIRDARYDDMSKLCGLLIDVPEIAFQPWELSILQQPQPGSKLVVKILEVNEAIVGAAIGGSCGERGTISHLWIAPEQRKLHLGQNLCKVAIGALLDNGAQHIHLMTVKGNDGANRFWTRQGFVLQDKVHFMERDI